MTSPISARLCREHFSVGGVVDPAPASATPATARAPRAFTLIELLVVIGIIGILAAFAVPAIYRTMRSGGVMKAKADFQVISTGLEAFRGDTGDYPRVDAPNTGFAVLARSLVAPGDRALYLPDTPGGTLSNPPATWTATKEYKPGDIVVQGAAPTKGNPNSSIYVCLKKHTGQTPSGTSPYWVLFWPYDELDGPGSKIRSGGPRSGPYVQADRIKLNGMALTDAEGNPILYFPASPKKPNINAANGFVATGNRTVAPFIIPLYDVNDNFAFFMTGTDTYGSPANAENVIQSMLGDFNPQDDNATTNHDGKIDSDKGENTLSTGPYLLWSAGNDGIFGPINPGTTPFPTKAGLLKCDDVTNFK